MKYFGITNDEKYVFMNEGFYYLENGESKFVKYNNNFLKNLCEIYKSNVEFEFNKNKINIQEKLLSSKKFLNIIYESFNLSKNDKLSLMIEWDKNFDSLYLINENTNSLLIEETYNNSWVYVDFIVEGFLDKAWEGTKKLASKTWEGTKKFVSGAWDTIKKGLSLAAQKIIIPIIKQGVIPLLRWIRRNLNTYFGIIADIILSLLPTVVVMKVVWGLICILGIYEIATGDYDPEDPERKEMPFVFLIGDLISFIFSAVAGKSAALSLKAGIKTLSKSPAAKKVLTTMLERAPGISKMFGSVKSFLSRLFGPSVAGFIGKLFGYVDTVVSKLIIWIRSLLGLTTKKAIKKTLPKIASGAIIGTGAASLFADKSFGEGKSGEYGKGKYVTQMQRNLLAMTSEGGDFNVGYKGPVTGVYDKQTGDAVYKLYQKLNMTPKREATPYISNFLGVMLEPSGLFKMIPQNYQASFGEFITTKTNEFKKFAKKMGVKRL